MVYPNSGNSSFNIKPLPSPLTIHFSPLIPHFHLFQEDAHTAEIPFTSSVSRFPSSIPLYPPYPFTPYPSRLTFHIPLLPAGGKDRLHILRLLIDGLIPGEPGLGAEGGHGLNELIHLGIE